MSKKSNILKMSDFRKTPRAIYENEALFTVRLHLEGEPYAECHGLTAVEAARHTLTLTRVLVKGFRKDYPDVCETTSRNIEVDFGRTTHYILSQKRLARGETADVLAKIEVELQYH